jgi:predicted RNA methylase
MAKLTKEQAKKHKQACNLLTKEKLSFDDKLFVLQHWNEGAENINTTAGAFFTPIDLSKDFSIEICEDQIIDLCAGIGALSFFAYHHKNVKDITCVEINPNYVEVGKKILPEATWICADVLDKNTILSLGNFKQAISNPPFGNIKTGDCSNWLDYKGSDFEFKVLDVASKIAKHGSFIVPQASTDFKYSGERNFTPVTPMGKVKKFLNETGLIIEPSCGIDTSVYLNDWKGVKPICEIINIDFTDKQGQQSLF